VRNARQVDCTLYKFSPGTQTGKGEASISRGWLIFRLGGGPSNSLKEHLRTVPSPPMREPPEGELRYWKREGSEGATTLEVKDYRREGACTKESRGVISAIGGTAAPEQSAANEKGEESISYRMGGGNRARCATEKNGGRRRQTRAKTTTHADAADRKLPDGRQESRSWGLDSLCTSDVTQTPEYSINRLAGAGGAK